MRLNEIKEIGFYCSPYDYKRNFIYEVIKNTDEEWLKEAPEQKLLIDEWLFDYIDNDDRAHYGTAGNLITVQNADDIEVVKIIDTKYKVEGGCGEYLVEDKLTYKEKCAKLQKVLKEIKKIAESGLKSKDCYEYMYGGKMYCEPILDRIKEAEDAR